MYNGRGNSKIDLRDKYANPIKCKKGFEQPWFCKIGDILHIISENPKSKDVIVVENSKGNRYSFRLEDLDIITIAENNFKDVKY